MASGSLLTQEAKKRIMERAYAASPTRGIPTQFKVGIDSSTPNIADTDLTLAVPISDGTIIDDGSNTLTGSNGGDNTTSGTARFKEGAGTTDATSQNLETNSSSATRTYTLSTLNSSVNGSQDFGFWLYINGTKSFNQFGSTGTVVSMRVGSDVSNYYYYERIRSQLSTGWNWLTAGTQVNALSMAGSVDGAIDTMQLELVTEDATDVFTSGSVIYDLARQWASTDLLKSWNSGTYPSINTTTLIAEMRGELATTEANGFDIDSFGDFNSTPTIGGEDVFTEESKSSTDKFTWIIQDRLN